MSEETNETTELRTYLFGEVESPSRREEIERRLMIDDDYFSSLSFQEDRLIQDYVDDELSSSERRIFEKNFLITEQRREALTFARLLRKYANDEKNQLQTVKLKPVSSGWKIALQRWFSPLSPIAPIAAFCLILAVGATFLVWNFYPRSVSDGQMTQVLLNKIYQRNRPLESRITEFNYAPFAINRGANEESFDSQERNRAENAAVAAAEDHASAANLHSLARIYLAKKEFVEAVKQLEKALRLEQKNAEILSDLGTAYLEQGKIFGQNNEAAKSLEMTAKALENFEKALEIDRDLPEARFNKAIANQSLRKPNQAREAWQDFLKLDSASPWADEARQNLKLLDLDQSQNKTAEEILQSFLTAFKSKDDENSYAIESRNREMITGKLIPQQLAFLFLETDGEKRDEYLRALEYVGALNREKSGDSYFDELAKFYASLTKEKQSDLQRAQISVRSGYRLSLETKRADALQEFKLAQEIFRRNGDVWEADFCDYWIGYLLYQSNELAKSTDVLNDLVARSGRYKWLASHALVVLTTNMIASNEFSKALDFNRRALTLAEETSDLYNTQKSLSQRAEIYRRVGDYRKALDFTEKNLRFNAQPEVSLRQKWRDLDAAATLFAAMKLYNTSASFEKEALYLAVEHLQDKTFNYQTYINLGLIYGAQEKYREAFDFFEKGRQIAENFSDEPLRNKSRANTNLSVATVQRQSKDCRQALVNYDKSLDFYDRESFQVNQYNAHKGRLLCYLEDKNDAAIQTELPIILSLFHRYRGKILGEESRNNFFAGEQSIYDIAIAYEFERGNYKTAFDYSEESRARSLLDLQNTSVVQVSRNDSIPEITFSPDVSEPLKFDRVQAEMPENVQLLQYSVLNDKTLIWLITKNEFSALKIDIEAAELQKKVSAYIELLNGSVSSEPNLETDSAKELYRILVAPIGGKLDASKQIGLIPDKILFRLPFAALVSPENEKYLIAEHTIFFSPSANIFLNCTKKALENAGSQTETLLSIGNPSFNRKDFPDLPDLAWANAEAKEIAKFYENKVLLIGKAATRQKINDELPNANLVHFAGHYVVDEHSPMLSSLILAENPRGSDPKEAVLANYDIVGSKLSNVRLIVLSACDTSLEGYLGGEGIIGAARSFLATGVPQVVASQWAVDSTAAAELMIGFHRHRTIEKLSTAEALRRAQLDILEGENKSFRKPVYWAAFTLLGGYSAT